MDYAIRVQGVSKAFKEVKAVQEFDLEIGRGEYVALLGPNGAGKTTLVEMIEGIQKPDSGEITINGLPWKNNEDHLHGIIGLSLQETNFIDKLKVDETLRLFASFYHLNENRVDEIIKMVNLEEKKTSFVGKLSGGQRQRLALGIAFLNQPQILLLDEPTTGLDPSARREVWDILVNLRNKYNTTMILTTHYMEEASYLCDRIVIMDKGKVLAKGTLENLLNDYMPGEIIQFSTDQKFMPENFPDRSSLKSHNFDPNQDRWQLVVDNLIDYLPELQKVVGAAGYEMTYLECRKMTLDDLFISMTGRHLDE